MSEIPTFDEAVPATLALLGASAGILGLVGAAFALYSWYAGLRGIAAGARQAGSVLSRAAAALIGMRPVQLAVAALATVIVASAQALTLGLCFLGGNYVSMIFNEWRWQLPLEVVMDDPVGSLHPDQWSQFLVLDWVVGAYLVLAVVVLGFSYRWALDDADLGGVGAVLALPATILLFIGGPLFLLALVVWALGWPLYALGGEGSEYLSDAVSNLLPGVVGLSATAIYYGACQAAVRGSGLLVRAWRSR